MTAKEITNDVKAEVTKQLERLGTLRDEVKLHIHLASLDAKQEWNDKLEPRIHQVQESAHDASDASKAAVHDLVTHIEAFVSKLRPGNSKA